MRVSVLGVPYEVKAVPNLDQERGIHGHCDPVAYEILLEASLSGEIMLRTLAHELSHALQFESGLFEFLEPQAREMQAQTMSAFLMECARPYLEDVAGRLRPATKKGKKLSQRKRR